MQARIRLSNTIEQKDSDEKWKDAYKENILNMESYLAVPYIFRQEPDRVNSDFCIGYIGIHDFDDDSVPELIIGDDVSVGIFTYDNSIVKRLQIYMNRKIGAVLTECITRTIRLSL